MLQKHIDETGLGRAVHLCGNTDDMAKVYQSADFYVMSSIYEGFPLVLVEAMQCQLPCVAYRISGTDAIIKDGENGFLIEDGDAEQFAAKCMELMDNPDLIQRMGAEAAKSCERFSKEKVMGVWIELFNEIIRQ